MSTCVWCMKLFRQKLTLFGLPDESDTRPVKEEALPEWVCVGESVLIRPSNASGVIAFLGPTQFAPGVWIGVDLDAPTGELNKLCCLKLKFRPLKTLGGEQSFFCTGLTNTLNPALIL